MKKLFWIPAILLALSSFQSCQETTTASAPNQLLLLDLKRGDVISCGPENEFGTVEFNFPGGKKVQEDFNLGMKLLHSFAYDEAEKVFVRIIEKEPGFAMGYWGVAMANFHPLWSPPSAEEVKKGSLAVELALKLESLTEKERDYLSGIAAYYTDHATVDHRTRCIRFEKAMEKLHNRYPEDKEASILYALALNSSADPKDKTYSNLLKAGDILNQLYPGQPNHPGIVHYIIHTYDVPELAPRALDAARKYASVAPSSSHALHMPSHIFTRMGLWEESIQSNRAAANSAVCYAQAAGMKGHWDEELHALDYLVYAHLQKGENQETLQQLDYVKKIKAVTPTNFKVAYSFAAMPARYVLENKLWKEAAVLEAHLPGHTWDKFPWEKAIIHYTRLLGSAHTGDLASAKNELKILQSLQQDLTDKKDPYKANQVMIQVETGKAWIAFKEGKKAEGIKLMKAAAELEEKTGKHPVTPGEVLPARELLGDMYLEAGEAALALEAYEADHKNRPNRFNGLLGAARAAEAMGDKKKALQYYKKLTEALDSKKADRPELPAIREFIKKQEGNMA